MNFFKTTAAALMIAAISFTGCKKVPTDDLPPEEPPVADEVLIQTDAEISATADSILQTADPIKGFRTFAEQYKKLPGVQDVDVYDDAMYVRYPDSIVHIWLLPPPEVPAEDVVAAAIEPLAAAAKQERSGIIRTANEEKPKKKIGFVNVIADEKPYTVIIGGKQTNMITDGKTTTVIVGGEPRIVNTADNVKEYIKTISDAYGAAGWKVTSVNGANADVNFFGTELNGYDALCIYTHGHYDKKTESIWLATGENLTKTTWSDNGVVTSVMTLPTAGDAVINYMAVSDYFIESTYEANHFPNTVIYTNACYSMASDVLANAFTSRGAKAFYGWNATNNLGWRRSVDVMTNLLKGYNIHEAMPMGIRYDREKDPMDPEGKKENNAVMDFQGREWFIMNPPSAFPKKATILSTSRVRLTASLSRYGGVNAIETGVYYAPADKPDEKKQLRDTDFYSSAYSAEHDLEYSVEVNGLEPGEYLYWAYAAVATSAETADGAKEFISEEAVSFNTTVEPDESGGGEIVFPDDWYSPGGAR